MSSDIELIKNYIIFIINNDYKNVRNIIKEQRYNIVEQFDMSVVKF